MSDEHSQESDRVKLRSARTISMPSRSYQPSKAEVEREFDMPEADTETVRKAFFRPIHTASDKDR